MQHVTTAEKSFLMGNEVADLLMRYAALIAQISGGDSVKVNAIDGSGDEVVATLLVNSGTVMSAETTNSTQPEPDNAALEQYLRQRIASYTDLPVGFADDDDSGGS